LPSNPLRTAGLGWAWVGFLARKPCRALPRPAVAGLGWAWQGFLARKPCRALPRPAVAGLGWAWLCFLARRPCRALRLSAVPSIPVGLRARQSRSECGYLCPSRLCYASPPLPGGGGVVVVPSYLLPSVSTKESAAGLLASADVAVGEAPAIAGGSRANAVLRSPTCLRIPEFESANKS